MSGKYPIRWYPRTKWFSGPLGKQFAKRELRRHNRRQAAKAVREFAGE